MRPKSLVKCPVSTRRQIEEREDGQGGLVEGWALNLERDFYFSENERKK
jgi:hypothetical protein